MSEHSKIHQMFASTVQPMSKSAVSSTSSGANSNAATSNIFATATYESANKRKRRVLMKPAHKASLATVICAYTIIVVFVLWLIFAFQSRRNASNQSLFMERTCVDLTRHKVKPITPAIDSVRGGDMEPFAFGTLTYDIDNEEITWSISDSLGVPPLEMAIHGPLADDNAPHAPVFIKLGVQRDSKLRLAGSATVKRDKLLELKQSPRKYYISVQESFAHNKVRELARDTLDKQCQKGVE